jgi:hypothetical protein
MPPKKTASKSKLTQIDISQPPKKPLTSYFLFAATVRDDIRKANPEMKMTAVSKEIGAQWKEVSESEKAKFVTLSENQRTKYTKEVEAFVAAGGDLKTAKAKKPAASRKRRGPANGEEEAAASADSSE